MAGMAGMAYVEIETPDGSHRVALERDRLRIGRLATNDVVLAFPQVSRQHAELRRVNGQWWIADLHSTNGLQLDTRRIQDHALRDGDRLVLAPGVSIRFHETRAGADGRARSGSGPLWEDSHSHARTPRGSSALPQAAQPVPLAPNPPSSAAPASAGSGGLAGSPGLSESGSGSAPDAAAPFALWSGSGSRDRDRVPTVPIDPGESDVYASIVRRTSARGGGGYPVPRGPLHSGAPVGGDDPYRREAAGGDAARSAHATAGPATLLHVCQTCGQRTAADAPSCQHCHNTIATECPNCRLSLLPIQDRCPRCHTPNTHSVRRVHARHTAF